MRRLFVGYLVFWRDYLYEKDEQLTKIHPTAFEKHNMLPLLLDFLISFLPACSVCRISFFLSSEKCCTLSKIISALFYLSEIYAINTKKKYKVEQRTEQLNVIRLYEQLKQEYITYQTFRNNFVLRLYLFVGYLSIFSAISGSQGMLASGRL